MTKKDYFVKLNELGIKYDEQEFETEDTLEGYVYKTEKEAGEKIDVEAGETLMVYVAKNPPKTEPSETEPTENGEIGEPFFTDFSAPVTDEPDIIITIYD